MVLFAGSQNGSQFNLAQNYEEPHGHKLLTVIIQLSILIFTGALIWFAFIYYPRAVKQYEGVGLPVKTIASSAADYSGFPIETEQFRIVFELDSNTYYMFVEGENIAVFAQNKNRATLALKNALSLTSVCDLNIIYSSTQRLDVPQELKNPAACK